MSFTAQDVKALREATGAGMMDCKKAKPGRLAVEGSRLLVNLMCLLVDVTAHHLCLTLKLGRRRPLPDSPGCPGDA